MQDEKWPRKVFAFGKRVIEAYRKTQEVRRLPLQERHQDIIERTERSMSLHDSQRHYVDDVTAQCLRDVAIRAGRRDVAPRAGEWLWKWRTRTGIQREYLELAQYLQGRFQNRYAEIRQEKQKADQRTKEGRYEEYKEWLSQNRRLVDRFLEVADRKVSLLDDYGDEKWEALPKEIQTCLLKFAQNENDSGATENAIKEALKNGYDWMVPEKYQWLKTHLESEFREYHEKRARSTAEPEFEELSGTEFETYLARLLKQSGFENIRGTAATGDQGADLLATKSNRTIVIQAKRYRGSVGNKAVQEVVAAVKFYSADEGWVITSGTFTPSAKALAQANGVRLIDGYGLRSGSLG
jgi:Restriction endonuclease